MLGGHNMDNKEVKDSEGQRLFKSNILEFFTRVHPKVAISYSLLWSATFIFINFHYGFVPSIFKTVMLFGLGFITWTLAEYLLHRFFFHMKSRAKWIQRIAHTMHGVHHHYPNDYSRLFMPPLPATLFIAFFFSFFYLILNVKVFSFLPGFLLGYLAYAYTHFKTHQIRPPKLLKFIWTHHLKHHYQDQDRAFGVSSPFWDIIFRTLPKKAVVKVAKNEPEVQEKEELISEDEAKSSES